MKVEFEHVKDAVLHARSVVEEQVRFLAKGNHFFGGEAENFSLLDALYKDEDLMELLAKRLNQVLAGTIAKKR